MLLEHAVSTEALAAHLRRDRELAARRGARVRAARAAGARADRGVLGPVRALLAAFRNIAAERRSRHGAAGPESATVRVGRGRAKDAAPCPTCT